MGRHEQGVIGMTRRGLAMALALLAMTGTPPVTAQGVKDGVKEPLREAGIAKKKVPEVLLLAASAPYSSAHTGSCADIAAEVGRLDEALGQDVDTPAARKGKGAEIASAASMGVVGALVPGFGLLKYVTGANAAEKRAQAAVYAGAVRRGYLKGLGLARRCPAPGRPTAASVAEQPELPESK